MERIIIGLAILLSSPSLVSSVSNKKANGTQMEKFTFRLSNIK